MGEGDDGARVYPEASTAFITPSDWSRGVDGTFAVISVPSERATRSVNVPPTSTPSRTCSLIDLGAVAQHEPHFTQGLDIQGRVAGDREQVSPLPRLQGAHSSPSPRSSAAADVPNSAPAAGWPPPLP